MGYEPLEELEIFKEAELIGDRYWDLVSTWDGFAKETVGKQLVRAADRIGAHIAESYGRFHCGERIQFLYHACGSVYETRFWTRRALKRGLMPVETANRAITFNDEFARKLNRYIRDKLDRKQNRNLKEGDELYLPDDDFPIDDVPITQSPNHPVTKHRCNKRFKMQRFDKLTATAIPLRMENVDTDQIIPARYLTAVTKEGMGLGLFSWIRYNADGTPKADFVLNQPDYQGAQILIAGRNFGSGSSREHAVWALTDYGFRCVITPGFADIFHNNSLKNGLLPVTLPEEVVNMLWDLVEEAPETALVVDLEKQTVTLPDGQQHGFPIDPFRKICLLEGLDDLGYILSKEEAVAAHEANLAY